MLAALKSKLQVLSSNTLHMSTLHMRDFHIEIPPDEEGEEGGGDMECLEAYDLDLVVEVIQGIFSRGVGTGAGAARAPKWDWATRRRAWGFVGIEGPSEGPPIADAGVGSVCGSTQGLQNYPVQSKGQDQDVAKDRNMGTLVATTPTVITGPNMPNAVTEITTTITTTIPAEAPPRSSSTSTSTIIPDVVLCEGSHLFAHPVLVSLAAVKIFTESDPDVRLARRVLRDSAPPRSFTLEQIFDHHVRFGKPAAELAIQPTKVLADIILPRGAEGPGVELIANGILDDLRALGKGASSGVGAAGTGVVGRTGRVTSMSLGTGGKLEKVLHPTITTTLKEADLVGSKSNVAYYETV